MTGGLCLLLRFGGNVRLLGPLDVGQSAVIW